MPTPPIEIRIQDSSTMRADRLLGLLKTLFVDSDFAGIIELAENIHESVTECSNDETCAEMMFFLGTAFSTKRTYAPAISCFNVAYALLTSDARQASSSVHTKTLLSKVCNGIATALAELGKFEEAHSYFSQCVSTGIEIAAAKQTMLPFVLSFAKNLHAQNQHKECIHVIHKMLAYGRDNDDDDDDDSDDISHYNVSYAACICPALLLGRCYTALGEYAKAHACFLQACRQAEDHNQPESIVEAQLNCAVVGWVSAQCYQHAFKRLWANSSESDLAGPPMPLALIQKHIVMLAANACKKLHGGQGEISVSVRLNGDGTPNRIMETGGMELMLVKWLSVEAENLDHTGFPLSMNLLLQVEAEEDRCFICKLVKNPNLVLGSEISHASVPHTLLTEYIGIVLHWAQFGNEKISKQSMMVVTSSIVDMERIASKHNLFELRQDCLFFNSIFVFGDGLTVKATQIFKDFLQHQVNLAKQPNPTCLTCKQICRGITVCGGCTVVRFCNKDHQKQASARPFFSTTIRHRKICHLLLLCKSLTKCISNPASQIAEATLLREQLDVAVVRFLQTNFSEKFIENAEDFEFRLL